MTEAEEIKALRHVATLLEQQGFQPMVGKRERTFYGTAAKWLRDRATGIEQNRKNVERAAKDTLAR